MNNKVITEPENEYAQTGVKPSAGKVSEHLFIQPGFERFVEKIYNTKYYMSYSFEQII